MALVAGSFGCEPEDAHDVLATLETFACVADWPGVAPRYDEQAKTARFFVESALLVLDLGGREWPDEQAVGCALEAIRRACVLAIARHAPMTAPEALRRREEAP